jgi:anaerobic selenocysteine-containing dehydrogenase
MQLRRPLVSPPPQCLEASQIFTRLADRLGLIPPIPDDLRAAADGDRMAFGVKLMTWAAQEPKALKAMPFVLGQSLGLAWDSAAKAALWGMLMTAPGAFHANAARAGFAPGPDLGDRVFQALLDTPQGLWVGKVDPAENLKLLRTPSGKIEVLIPELAEETQALDAKGEAEALRLPATYPMILNAGRHTKHNANTLMRNPAWNEGRRACTVAVHADDAQALGLTDGQQVKVTTEAGSEKGELEVSDQVRPGTVLIPHGFGLQYGETVYGINVNRLTKNTHRDPIGTPLHRFVPCRIEAA